MADGETPGAASLEQKLAGFEASLDDDERAIFRTILVLAVTDDADVEGFGAQPHMRPGAGAVAGALNSGTELDMITLQTLMSQRQTAVTTCTALLQAQQQTSQAVAKNFGS
jgi:hypothetical protein